MEALEGLIKERAYRERDPRGDKIKEYIAFISLYIKAETVEKIARTHANMRSKMKLPRGVSK